MLPRLSGHSSLQLVNWMNFSQVRCNAFIEKKWKGKARLFGHMIQMQSSQDSAADSTNQIIQPIPFHMTVEGLMLPKKFLQIKKFQRKKNNNYTASQGSVAFNKACRCIPTFRIFILDHLTNYLE